MVPANKVRSASIDRRFPSRRRNSLPGVAASLAIVVGEVLATGTAEAVKPPDEIAPFVEHVTRMPIGREEFFFAKLNRGDKFEQVAYDAKGTLLPAVQVQRRYLNQFKGFGKIHPTLQDRLQRRPTDSHTILLWLELEPPPRIEKPSRISGEIEKTLGQLREAHGRSQLAFEERKLSALKKLGLEVGKLLREHRGTPFVAVKGSATEIKALAGDGSVRMVLPLDTEGVVDLTESLEISGADDVIASGIRGEGIKLAVWENCPDSTAQLAIEASFADDEGLNCTASQHARHVTGIIRNTTATPGFAPDSQMFSADRTSLDALDWAIDDKHVSALNQSFHRNAEIGDGMQADDLYKDFKILHYPWPTIIQAAGNWCPSGSSCFEGGSDVLDEFVNHKGFNSISVGNHNDDASEMSASSCFVNPSSPHGDRELPELAANGTQVDAVGLTLSGTSMASPAVVGSVALLQQANSVLRIWPEGNRALLFAGSRINVPNHAGQLADGSGPAADAPNTWWQDVSAGRDGFDGAGAMDVERSREIAKKRYANAALQRGFDIGTYFAASSFDRSGFATKTYKISFPRKGGRTHGKVALAWNSTATVRDVEPEQVFASLLEMDLDLRIYDKDGVQVGRSLSWDNSYEVADFKGKPGETYTIKVHRWSAQPGSWTWFGIAWDVK